MFDLDFNPEAFLPDPYPKICILSTDVVEPEILIRVLAEKTAKSYPDTFKGEAPQVFYRMRYMPPYEAFQEIRKLILQIRNATGIRSSFNGIMVIDVSEYKGHEDEEYFTIFLKYLYDNSCGCKSILVCSQYTEKELQKLVISCTRFFPVQQEVLNIYELDQLKALVKASFKERRYKLDTDSIDLIADILTSEKLVSCRTLQLIDRIPDEIQIKKDSCSSKLGLTLSEAVKEYFRDPHSPVCLLAGSSLLAEKEGTLEQTL